jgi:uncharacterized protein (DUF58 family)
MAAPTAADQPDWVPTAALRRGIGLAALALLAAAALGRAELVLLAVPFALGTVVSLLARPARPPAAALTLAEPTSVEGGPVRARVSVHSDHPQRMLAVVTAQIPRWVRLHHGLGYYAALVRPAATTTIRLEGTARRWGAYRLGPATVRTVACDGLLVVDSRILPAVPLAVYPVSAPFDSDQALPRAAGISGIHRSRRPGSGGELADVRPFAAGDRLRRINWRVSRRTGELHVNATWSDRDAEVVLLLDVRQEAGASGGVDGAASVLDATVRAAAAITEHYTHQGDRVSLVEYGSRLRRLRAGTGRQHYLAALEWLVAVDRFPSGFGPGDRLVTGGLRGTGALVVVLTPLLDQDSANLLATLARAGRWLVAVDTLPDRLRWPVRGEWSTAGRRLWWLERENTVGRLRGVGVPVEPWRGAGSLDAMLRHVYRLASSSRVLAR